MLTAFSLPDNVDLCRSRHRSRMLKTLLDQFRLSFTEIDYEVDTRTRVVNAQAFGHGDLRFVCVYGGLAFHPLVTEDALTFALLHETGHLRARGRRFAGDPTLACDCVADAWAVEIGAKTLRLHSGRAINLPKALDSLGNLIFSIEKGRSAAVKTGRTSEHTCWARDWSVRKSRLWNRVVQAPAGPCYFQSFSRKRR